METVGGRAARVAQRTLDESLAAVPRIMHVQANLLDGVRELGPRDGEVLESPGDAAVRRRVRHTRAASLRKKPASGVDGRGRRLAGVHARAFDDLLGVLLLTEEEARLHARHLNAEEVAERAKVLHGELNSEPVHNAMKKSRSRGGEDDIVDVKKKRRVRPAGVDEQGGVGARRREADRLEEADERLEPGAGSLFKPVKRLVQTADMVRPSLVDEACGLEAVHLLGERPMQERILDVQLVDGPPSRSSYGENSADGGWLDHRREGLAVVHARMLMKAADDPPRLVAFQRAVSAEFVLEDPFAYDQVGARRTWNQLPSTVGDERGVLFAHGREPVQIADGDAHRAWHGRERSGRQSSRSVVVLGVRLEDVGLSPGQHTPRRAGQSGRRGGDAGVSGRRARRRGAGAVRARSSGRV
ncbi:uncharacterized protein [Triticum aestivum]|uniref:uncharacterized protein n=1 Tax=Triticum aestivum TaxID=4565 RepID=UPI001D00B3A4|nr:uncharacterized protein LOC123078363 [Triticum aestivum]